MDEELREHYDFDLLLYRLDLKRLKRELFARGKNVTGNYKCLADFSTHEGKRIFTTYLIYPDDHLPTLFNTGEISVDDFFDDIFSRGLAYLDKKFIKKNQIDGFAFEISFSKSGLLRERKTLIVISFPKNVVKGFVRGRIDRAGLYAKAAFMEFRESPPLVMAETPSETGPKVMKWSCEADGLAKKGRFVRRSSPRFSFEYPEYLMMEELGEELVFRGNGTRSSSSYIYVLTIHSQVFNVGVMTDEEMQRFVDEAAAANANNLREDLALKANIMYTRPISPYQGCPAFEYRIKWDRKRKYLYRAGLTTLPMTTYCRIIFKEDCAILLTGAKDAYSPNYLKDVFNTLNLDPPLFILDDAD